MCAASASWHSPVIQDHHAFLSCLLAVLQSAADLQRLHYRQWDWALAVHGSEDAALAAGAAP
jgi:hypothetical protein